MSQDPRLFSPVFSIDVCTDAHTAAASTKIDANELIVSLLKQLVDGQQQELKLLSEIAHWVGVSHKQRQQEITQWKDANPDLARSCRIASEALVLTSHSDSLPSPASGLNSEGPLSADLTDGSAVFRPLGYTLLLPNTAE